MVAELFLAGILSPDGSFDPNIESDRMKWEEGRKNGAYILAKPEQSSSGKSILITQEDVRNIQLAKAALYAGAKLLMRRAEIDRVDEIIMAGAFGSYISPKHAMILGLIPDCDLEKVHAVGNAAGDGARIALINREKRLVAQQLARRVRYIETAVDENFQDEFVKAIHIPHQKDAFPHIADLLPEKTASATSRRTRRFPRART